MPSSVFFVIVILFSPISPALIGAGAAVA